jgi:hypothetical protein
LKKLPALPSTRGSGSFARRIATTASNTSRGVAASGAMPRASSSRVTSA